MRAAAASVAATSVGVSSASSVRVTTRIAGTTSPPGNSARVASARADSADAGTGTGDWLEESPVLTKAMSKPDASTTNRAAIQDFRDDTGTQFFSRC